MSDDTLASLGRALGAKYEVKRLVGSGGFAEVYEVWDKDLERRLAVKVLRPDVAWTSGMAERFQREMRAVARLEHPNVLPIHFVGEGEGLVYYAMPFVVGMSLGELLKRSGALPPERALAIVIPILDALDHAHKSGLLHRDIKPDNIMLDTSRGKPLLVDFGIARRLDSDAAKGLTQTGLVIGTPHYMSPEQALGDPNLGPTSDIYSLGAVLFQMVTGEPPFDGESSQQIVGKHIADPPPDAAAMNRKVPRRLADVILRCMEKQPRARFQSAREVIAALEGGVRKVDVQAATELVATLPPHPRAHRKRRGWVPALLALLVLGVVGAGAWWWSAQPSLVLSNQLAIAIDVNVGGEQHRVEPGARFTMRPRARGLLKLMWTAQQRLGVPFGDTLTVANPSGRIFMAATAHTRSGAYFQPLITNETGVPLSITVNAGFAVARSCQCTIPPGAVRLAIGYYPLFQNSTVRAEGRRRSATFTDLGPQVDAAKGTVGLLFRAQDMK